jgi:DNA-binding transcriptional regulator GbsR (MarR family)
MAEIEELRDWSEQVASFFVRMAGWPPITGRVLGWLLVCDPAEQSAAELAEAIQSSRASLTGTLRVLTTAGLVHQVTRVGGRTTYYRIDDGAWSAVLRQRFQHVSAFTDITRRGMAMLGEDSPAASRVRAAHDVFRWFDDVIEPLWERYEKERGR